MRHGSLDRPRNYLVAFTVLMAASIAFPDEFELASVVVATVVVVLSVLLLARARRQPRRKRGQ